ncbi:hypothetical protein Tco_0511095, partial [Tanacetum coccineum]
GGDPKTHDLGSCGEDGDVVEVPETLFEEERHSNDIPVEENTNPKENHSKDFPIYPPGFTPAAKTNEPCTDAENADSSPFAAYNSRYLFDLKLYQASSWDLSSSPILYALHLKQRQDALG